MLTELGYPLDFCDELRENNSKLKTLITLESIIITILSASFDFFYRCKNTLKNNLKG